MTACSHDDGANRLAKAYSAPSSPNGSKQRSAWTARSAWSGSCSRSQAISSCIESHRL
jgi:hypothetical protein